MALKTILVHVDSSRSTPERLAVAVALAEAHGARLIGVHATGVNDLAGYLEPTPELLEAQARWAREEGEKSRKLFQDATGRTSAPPEWRETEGDAVRVLAMQSHYGDLLVLGQHNPDLPAYRTPATLVGDLLFASARPLLVVPYIGGPTSFGRILIAWNASREAARAVNDALPLLVRAEQVTVLAINPEGGLDGHGDVPSADLCVHLARHGVRAEAAQLRAEDIDAGNMLLSHAADLAVDLIVMGGYGHSRLRETVLGGMTRTILRQMTVPVLLSH
jgi:nucleotide-binding universal stress UspA family protein